jgi:hypothetical protein
MMWLCQPVVQAKCMVFDTQVLRLPAAIELKWIWCSKFDIDGEVTTHQLTITSIHTFPSWFVLPHSKARPLNTAAYITELKRGDSRHHPHYSVPRLLGGRHATNPKVYPKSRQCFSRKRALQDVMRSTVYDNVDVSMLLFKSKSAILATAYQALNGICSFLMKYIVIICC